MVSPGVGFSLDEFNGHVGASNHRLTHRDGGI